MICIKAPTTIHSSPKNHLIKIGANDITIIDGIKPILATRLMVFLKIFITFCLLSRIESAASL
jgi:hypothetical protein